APDRLEDRHRGLGDDATDAVLDLVKSHQQTFVAAVRIGHRNGVPAWIPPVALGIAGLGLATTGRAQRTPGGGLAGMWQPEPPAFDGAVLVEIDRTVGGDATEVEPRLGQPVGVRVVDPQETLVYRFPEFGGNPPGTKRFHRRIAAQTNAEDSS